MLTITVPKTELFDERTEEFITLPPVVLELEHSLASLSKWESIVEKPFLGKTEKTAAETRFYIECMIVTPDFPRGIVQRMSRENLDQINAYLESAQSATRFGDMPKKSVQNEVVTAELIYYWLVAFRIPFEVETWHLNRLFSLIRICNAKNSPPKKRSAREIAAERRRLNEQRRQQYGTTG